MPVIFNVLSVRRSDETNLEMKMSKVLNKVSNCFAYIYVLIIGVFKTFYKKKKILTKDVLIVMPGHLGNAILAVDTILSLQKYYCSDDKRKLSLICSKSNWRLLQIIGNMNNIQYLDVGFDNSISFREVRKRIKCLKKKRFDKIIVTLAHNSISAGFIVAAIDANEKIGVLDDKKTVRKSPRWFFERFYSTPIYVDIDCQEMQRLKLINQEIGNISYQVNIHYIPKIYDYRYTDQPYVTIVLDSSSKIKRWESEKFSYLIDYIIETYHYRICLIGANVTEDEHNECLKRITHKEFVDDFISKTNMEEWIELIRNSEFLIGVDSGSIHISASVGTKSFCLCGVYDGKRVFPYVVDKLSENVILPEVIFYDDNNQNIHCYACRAKNGKIGCGNKECLKRCNAGLSCLCLNKISVNRVIERLNYYMLASKSNN